MRRSLTILARTAMAHYSVPFLLAFDALATRLRAEYVVAAEHDVFSALTNVPLANVKMIPTFANKVPDNIVDVGVRACETEYILRLDDDELVSPVMEAWLASGAYRMQDHWQFPRMHLYQNTATAIISPQLWPDHQTRLSVRQKAGGLHGQHAGSPFGGGVLAPVWLEHYKFVVRDHIERTALAKHYDSYCDGHGTGGMRAFCLPEDEYADGGCKLVPYSVDVAVMTDRIAKAQAAGYTDRLVGATDLASQMVTA